MQNCDSFTTSDTFWVFFDLDDTLWDFTANSMEALEYLYISEKILQDVFPNFESFSNAYHNINSSLWELYHAGQISRDFLKAERFESLLRSDLNTFSAHNEAVRLDSKYLNVLAEIPRIVEGAEDVLTEISKFSLIGIVSNGFLSTQYRKLEVSGLQRFIQRMIVSDEIGIQKPAKAIFDYALAETGAFRDRAIMIGDNPDADIRGAIEAGWKAIYFNRKGKDYCGPGNPPVITRLEDCIPLIKVFQSEAGNTGPHHKE